MRIERAEKVLGAGRVRYIHPDCGFWMLKRSIADAKMRALARAATASRASQPEHHVLNDHLVILIERSRNSLV